MKATYHTLIHVTELLARTIQYQNDVLVLAPNVPQLPATGQFASDPSGYEAFVNHIHLEDELELTIQHNNQYHAAVRDFGRVLLHIWSERMYRVLPDTQSVLFYLGGADSVTLRFHLQRETQTNWIDIHNTQFLQHEQIEVYRLAHNHLVRL